MLWFCIASGIELRYDNILFAKYMKVFYGRPEQGNLFGSFLRVVWGILMDVSCGFAWRKYCLWTLFYLIWFNFTIAFWKRAYLKHKKISVGLRALFSGLVSCCQSDNYIEWVERVCKMPWFLVVIPINSSCYLRHFAWLFVGFSAVNCIILQANSIAFCGFSPLFRAKNQ